MSAAEPVSVPPGSPLARSSALGALMPFTSAAVSASAGGSAAAGAAAGASSTARVGGATTRSARTGPLGAIGRARPDGRRHPFPLRAGAPVRRRLLDAAEAPEGHPQQHEPDDRHRPAEPEQTGGGQREAHDEHEQIPPLCRGRSHAFVLLLARYTAAGPRSPVRMRTTSST